MQRIGLLFILTIVTVALLGCAGVPLHYADETIRLGYVKRIAILPFENHTQTKYAEERLRDIISTEILSRGFFEVIEKGDLSRFLQEELVNRKQETIDLPTAQRLARDLKVDAYLAGSVDDFSETRSGSYAYSVVAATFRLVDVKTGKIIWETSGSESGYSTFNRIFGFDGEDINQISFKLVRKLLDTIQMTE